MENYRLKYMHVICVNIDIYSLRIFPRVFGGLLGVDKGEKGKLFLK
jgi:hypothetical protein